MTDLRQGTRSNDRRRVLRFPFIANAEIRSAESTAFLAARVTDLSLYGCYVDLSNPLPTGSEIFVRISTPPEIFESRATVVYSHPNLGMGLAFRNVEAHFLPILREWLNEAAKRAAVVPEIR